jgi:hypothetical protein
VKESREMKMINKTVLTAFLSGLFILCLVSGTGSQNLGVGYSPYYGAGGRYEKPMPKDPFMEKIAAKFNTNTTILYSLQEKGYGRLELIRMFLIAQKAGKSIGPVVEARDNKLRLSAIARKFSVDYETVYDESYRIKTELENSSTVYAETGVAIATGPVCGGTTSCAFPAQLFISTANFKP